MTEPWNSRLEGDCLITEGSIVLQSRSSRLFVRPCYRELFDLCKSAWTQGNLQGVFVYGTPGIGKSCFLDYVLHRCLEDNKKVLYLYGKRNKAYLFQPNAQGNTTFAKYKLTAVMDEDVKLPPDSFDIVLFDPHENAADTNRVHHYFFRGKNFLVALSPDEDNCEGLRKDTLSKIRCYMGTVSKEEAEDMRICCYPHVSKALLNARYGDIGGIPRYLFHDFGDGPDDEAVTEVEKKQTKALRDIVKCPDRIDGGEVAARFKHLWSIFHLRPVMTNNVTNYRKYTIELYCEDARIRIRDLLMKKDVKDLWELFSNTLERHGTLKGIRYEAYAHKKIMTEGIENMTAHSLTGNGLGRSRKQIDIPAHLPATKLVRKDLDAFEESVRTARKRKRGLLPQAVYLLPCTSNFPVVDSVFVCGSTTLSLQMKAGRSKPLSVSGPSATTIKAAAGGDLIFVVPDESIITRKLRYSDGAGPNHWKHYRLVLKEP